jgi:endonuclease/exonuclease/phosphatase family metal-dependent hydrolase
LKPGRDPKVGGYIGFYDSKPSNPPKHGTAILVKDSIKTEEVYLDTDLNAVAVKVHLDKVVTVVSVYISPSDVQSNRGAERKAAKVKGLIEQLDTPYLVMGDFNAHSRSWGSGKKIPFGNKLADLFETLDTLDNRERGSGCCSQKLTGPRNR